MRALDTQLDLLQFIDSAKGWGFTKHWAEARYESYPQLHDEVTLDEYARAIQAGQLYTVGEGATYAVSDDIFQVIDQASHLLPEDAVILPSDIPTPMGVIVFEHPIPIPDDKGVVADISVIAWAAVDDVDSDDSNLVSFSNDGFAKAGRRDEEDDETLGRGVLIFAFADRDGPNDTVLKFLREKGVSEVKMQGVARHSLWHWEPIAFDHPAPGHLEKLLFTFWRFVGETWIDSRMVLPDRPARKRAIRARVNPEVRVVRLRKSEVRSVDRGDGDDAAVIWSHRWIVDGHWRSQWYPSLQTHRPKWIPKHIKGPDHLPLILKDRVFSVDR